MPSKKIDNKEIEKNFKILKKNIVLIIIAVLLITIVGTFAWLSWKSRETALVLTIGDIDETQVVLKPYQINTEISPVLSYDNEEYVSVTAVNNGTSSKLVKLFYKISNIDAELVSTDFKYTITKSTDDGVTYKEYFTGNFSTASSNSDLYIIEEKIQPNTTYKYRVYLWLDGNNSQVNIQGKSFKAELSAEIGDASYTAAEMLIANANPSSLMYADATESQKGEMWIFTHDATEQTGALTDYRYIGNTPNNYITFNNEVWRIIGVFDGRIKIIKDDIIGNMCLDIKDKLGSAYLDSTRLSAHGSNDWTDAQLMYMLNPTTYKLNDGYSFSNNSIYDKNNKVFYQLGCKPARIAGGQSYSCTANTWSLDDVALSQISDAVYYLGGSSSDSGHDASAYYTFERGIDVYSGRPTNWQGYVGLMYPSDYAYTFANGVDDKCYADIHSCSNGTPKSSWLYKSDSSQWTISPYNNLNYMFYINFTGNAVTGSAGYADIDYNCNQLKVRPVAYLKSDIQLTGNGTSTEPYEIVG